MPLPLQSLLGIPVLLVLAWLFSENRRAIPWRSVGAGLLLQLILALVLLKLPGSRNFFLLLNNAVQALEQATREGTSFVFGYLCGGEIPFKTKQGADTYILAFQGLPLILVISALSSLLFYWGILQRIVRGFSFVLRRKESLSERSRLIMTYAMCGFANPGSLGIMLGGLGGLAPERKAEIAGMGLKSILAGTLATCLTGSIVGMLFW